jgi:uncharacterized membrane protein YqjE
MLSLIVSTAILVATVAVLCGWAMRKERRLRARAQTLQELEGALETRTREERDARDHRLSA